MRHTSGFRIIFILVFFKKKTINLIDQDVDPTACIEFTNFYLSLTNNSWRAVVSQSLTATLPE